MTNRCNMFKIPSLRAFDASLWITLIIYSMYSLPVAIYSQHPHSVYCTWCIMINYIDQFLFALITCNKLIMPSLMGSCGSWFIKLIIFLNALINRCKFLKTPSLRVYGVSWWITMIIFICFDKQVQHAESKLTHGIWFLRINYINYFVTIFYRTYMVYVFLKKYTFCQGLCIHLHL